MKIEVNKVNGDIKIIRDGEEFIIPANKVYAFYTMTRRAIDVLNESEMLFDQHGRKRKL